MTTAISYRLRAACTWASSERELLATGLALPPPPHRATQPDSDTVSVQTFKDWPELAYICL